MVDTNHQSPGFLTAAARLARTGVGAVQNRIELFVVEWEEERVRMMKTFVWAAGLVLLGALSVLLFTATIIFLLSPDVRIYAVLGFAVLYLIGAIVAAVGLRAVAARESFPESLAQIRKDRAWLESLK